MNEVTSKEKQCEDTHKALEHDRWDNLYCEGIFKTNTKETGMGKSLQLATRELGNPIAE